ncbi:P-type conjugative transfer protein TrbJ [Novosphingobium malaysiense]|uniref:Conjugal transfer protein TrbJ n=1 Tax=Novosphingobium malaysiense TaxID=1348853 RepID=A0A0B1ZRK8_9SPHN|nr:P-type conjugative transfer protein TrbJ [Novosphingobium malaysiense]KHK91878.1 conjugal transfer protein TrbJ [Novosphingobium malaysiense]
MKTRLVSVLLSATATTGLLALVALPAAPARAFIVFDPSNYAQNVLTAARTLKEINNQIRSLQNEAQMLVNQAKNLTRIDFPQLQELQQKLQQIEQLMDQAQGLNFRVEDLDSQFRAQFPDSFSQLAQHDTRLASAKARLDTAMASFRQTMGLQSQIVENVRSDTQTLTALAQKSQDAEGALQAGQATNQLLALAAKQQMQIETLMAAQFRADAIEQARRGQTEREAREATIRFLGDGTAYTPK